MKRLIAAAIATKSLPADALLPKRMIFISPIPEAQTPSLFRECRSSQRKRPAFVPRVQSGDNPRDVWCISPAGRLKATETDPW